LIVFIFTSCIQSSIVIRFSSASSFSIFNSQSSVFIRFIVFTRNFSGARSPFLQKSIAQV